MSDESSAESEGLDHHPRARIVCGLDEGHMDLVIVGTPMPLEFFAGLPTKCHVCAAPLVLAEPPLACDFSYAADA